MNKKLSMAISAAMLALGANTASAGIVIPAGDWTLDINGNVNAFYIYSNNKGTSTVAGGLANAKSASANGKASSINTGLLPSWFGVTGKKRENDLDISWTFSVQQGASSRTSLQGGGGAELRQANLTFGDASWGTVKIGKDLGVFASDAILNDQTLLGVGSQGIVGAAGGTTTTLGRIGAGFLYADFKGQINYTSPNWNGFQFTAGIAQPWNTVNLGGSPSAVASGGVGGGRSAASSGANKSPAFEGKASYSWTGDVSGKVWAEFWTQKVDGISKFTAVAATPANRTPAGTGSQTATAYAVGGKAAMSGFEVVGYYYDGEGVGTTALLADGFSLNGTKRDSNGGYVQGSYKIPGAGTKIAASWGISNLDANSNDTANAAIDPTIKELVKENEMWTIGAYHPLTSNLNLVAEYSDVKSKNQAGARNKSSIVSFGGILFF